MPSEKQPFYDPVPPTYDQAVAGSSRRREEAWSQRDEREAPQTESQGLLSNAGASSSRRPEGHRQTAGSDDDDDSVFDGLSDIDEADQVRQEMEEMDIEEPESSRSSWRKRIPFRLSLPRWNWPSLPRVRIQLPSREESSSDDNNESSGANETSETAAPAANTWTLNVPKFNSVLVIVTIARILALFIIIGFFYFLFSSGILSGPSAMEGRRRFNPTEVEKHIVKMVDPGRLREVVQEFASYAHLAGTEGDDVSSMVIKQMFTESDIPEVWDEKYNVYLNWPKEGGRAVEIMDGTGEKAVFSAVIEEDERHSESAGRQTFAFHGHSKSGDVKGPLVYANYGSRSDYQKLKDDGIDTNGSIALVRYYGSEDSPALKVCGAELAGFAGCIIYSDPADDGFVKGEEAPKGRYMPSDGVHRASVSLSNMVLGDVLTPGYASTMEEMQRLTPEDAPGLVGIPSLPIPWRDAQILLQNLKGHGKKVADEWKGGVPKVDEWWTGDKSSPIVRLKNEQDEQLKPIYNVYGRIKGLEQAAKSIIIGNHRDSFAFGAADPHSGTAVLVMVAALFGDLYRLGWRPLRTLEFMSWDGGAYNMIGSTEYVEKNVESLRQNAYAYINLDAAVTGNELHAGGSPAFKRVLLEVISHIQDPNLGKTLRQLWDERQGDIENLGTDSDYAAFQDIAGTSVLDIGFKGGMVPHQSSYDTFNLVDSVIDHEFTYHSMLSSIVGIIAFRLADRPIMPLDMRSYADKLGQWVDDLSKWIQEHPKTKDLKEDDKQLIRTDELKDSTEMIKGHIDLFDSWESMWDEAIRKSNGWEKTEIGAARDDYNNRMAMFETALLDLEDHDPRNGDPGGLPHRPQFRNVVYGPQLWPDGKNPTFPAIRDHIEAGDWAKARDAIQKASALLRKAATTLQIPHP